MVDRHPKAIEDAVGRGWLFRRLQRHLAEMARLSGPAILSRIGIVSLGLIDTAMVGRYATQDLAILSLANGSVILIPLVLGLGLMMGVLIYTASAYGREDWAECGQVLRRALPMAWVCGALTLLVCMPAELWLRLLGQEEAVVPRAADIVRILALGLPAHVLYATFVFFLEGVKRPVMAMWFMVAANLINIILNYGLIFGEFGLPELGAEGSAITSTIVRWAMAAMAFGYIWYHPSMRPFAVRQAHPQPWSAWAGQRAMGYSSAVALGAEVSAFAALTIIAGWMGTLPLAAHGIAMGVMTVPFMLASGVGSATSVRVGIAFGRGDRADAALAGWTGLLVGSVALAVCGLAIMASPQVLFQQFSDDRVLLTITLLPILMIGPVLLFDGGQAIMSMGLRGLGDVWWPTAIQAFSYFGVMIPCALLLSGAEQGEPLALVAALLANSQGAGPVALFVATLIGSVVSVGLLCLRFQLLTVGRAHR